MFLILMYQHGIVAVYPKANIEVTASPYLKSTFVYYRRKA